MDDDARGALEQFCRSAVSSDLDSLAREIGELRAELRALRAASGLDPSDRTRRQATVAALRAEGHSTRAIGLMVGANRATVQADLDRLNMPRPELIAGLDGRLTKGPPPPSVA
jgi:DNA-binding CsgD family transcriptional regulator